MDRKTWIALAFGALGLGAGGFWFCGGEIDEPQTTTITSGSAAAVVNPEPTTNPIESARNPVPVVPNVVQTAAPKPQAPQPPCTSCPPDKQIPPREEPY